MAAVTESDSEYEDDEWQSLVIDTGSYMTKAGYSGDDAPRTSIPSIKYPVKQDNMSLNYPIKHGIINNKDDLEMLYYQILYKELEADPSEHPVLLSKPLMNVKANNQILAEIMFETFDVPSMYIEFEPILAFYAIGRTSGIIIQCGDGLTQTMPIYEGYTISSSIRRTNIAGYEITNHLMKLLDKNGHSFHTSIDKEIVRDIKEKYGYICMDYDKTMKDDAFEMKEYELPDGKKINIGKERVIAPEILFEPEIIGSKEKGIDKLLYDCIMNCDMDTRRDFYCNILLSGGCTMLEGFGNRLKKEMIKLLPATRRIRIVSPPERKYAVWMGGSILSSLSTFQNVWLEAEEYDEYGYSFVHRGYGPY